MPHFRTGEQMLSRQGSRKQSHPLPGRAVLRMLHFTAQYSQASAFPDVVNLPSSSCRSNCQTCIKLTVEKVSAHFSALFLSRKHSYRSRPGCQMVQEKKSTMSPRRAFPGANTHRRFMFHNGKVSVSNKAEPRVIKAPLISYSLSQRWVLF